MLFFSSNDMMAVVWVSSLLRTRLDCQNEMVDDDQERGEGVQRSYSDPVIYKEELRGSAPARKWSSAHGVPVFLEVDCTTSRA
jgi:hypothetical protein